MSYCNNLDHKNKTLHMCSALIILSNRLSDEISSALTFVHVNILLKQNGQTIVACNVDLRHINMQRPSPASIMSEDGIEKSVTMITVWHDEACRLITNGDSEGRIFLSCPHTNNGFFFLLIPVFYCLKISFQVSLNTIRCNFTR